MPSNDLVPIVNYDDAAFLEICNEFFLKSQEFMVACNPAKLKRCRKAADLFLQYEYQHPEGWGRLKMLARLGLAGMPVAPLMAVCNKATLLGWVVLVQSDGNMVLNIKPRSRHPLNAPTSHDKGPGSQ